MTRINCGIPVRELTNQHLLAEHREIKRIPNTISSGKAVIKDIPSDFRLGTGHVKFFYDKLLYLKNRYIEIYDECVKREFNITNYIEAWDDIPTNLMNDYSPTDYDREIVRARIKERLEEAEAKAKAKSEAKRNDTIGK
tara:strand:+ start:42 stop:458 length:417 start_codon:yes stop_codon:yes gene_type:complete